MGRCRVEMGSQNSPGKTAQSLAKTLSGYVYVFSVVLSFMTPYQPVSVLGFYYFNFRSETIHELVVAELHYHPPRKETLIPHLEVSPICTLSSQ